MQEYYVLHVKRLKGRLKQNILMVDSVRNDLTSLAPLDGQLNFTFKSKIIFLKSNLSYPLKDNIFKIIFEILS